MVFIIGVDHRIQWIPRKCGQGWAEKIEEFMRYIAQQCQEQQVDLIAEEFNEEAVKLSNAEDSTARRVAGELSHSHLFCDPDSKEREELGASDCERRENEWLRRLKFSGCERVLFICGDKHVDTFVEKLKAGGENLEIVSRGFWGIGWEMIT